MQVIRTNEIKTKTSIDLQSNLEQIICRSECRGEILFSFELVCCKNDDKQFYQKLFSDIKDFSPLFYSLTWHNRPCLNDSYLASLETLAEFPKNTLFHLAARGLIRNTAVQILNRVLELDIRNLFIIRGDGDSDDGDFVYAIDLIKFIKEQYNEKFCIGVAGYPNKHPESLSKEADLHYLKEKVEAGASFIITQIILESSLFIDFVKDCKNYGIHVPIIPLVMPILSYESFIKMTKICSLTGPQYLYDDLISLKDNTKAVQQYGIQLTINIVDDIISNHCASIFHLCTLNNASIAVELCKRISKLIAQKQLFIP